jgi:hypothetical protein
MVLFPLPGATYTTYCQYGAVIFPWTSVMQLRRFKQIRSLLHFNLNPSEVRGKYVMHKTHPILNTLKKTLGTFLIPGSDLSLDETSCVLRSNYGCELISFNSNEELWKVSFSVLYDLRCLGILLSHFEGRDNER